VAAQLKIGDAHFYGSGVTADMKKALSYYRSASEAKNAQVVFQLCGYL
jgi:SEL1 protein